MYIYLSIVLLALGLTLLMSPNTILSKDSEYQKMIHENNKLVGALCLGGAYYTYTLSTSTDSPTTPLLPSYDEATTSSSNDK